MADIRIAKPAAGVAENIPSEQGARFVFDFPTTDATLVRDGNNLAINFPDGSQVNLQDFYTEYDGDNLPTFEMDGQEIEAQDFFTAMNEPDLMPAAGPGTGETAADGARYHAYDAMALANGIDHLWQLDWGMNRAFDYEEEFNSYGLRDDSDVDAVAQNVVVPGSGIPSGRPEPNIPDYEPPHDYIPPQPNPPAPPAQPSVPEITPPPAVDEEPEKPDNPVIVKPEDPNRPDPDGPKGEDPDNPEDPGHPEDNPNGTLNVNNDNDVLTVYEKFLPDGTEDGKGSLVAKGTMDIYAPDGVAKIEIGGKLVWENGSLVDDPTIKTDEGTFTVTGYDPTTGKLTYEFELERPTDEHRQPGDDSIHHTLTVVVTDTDGDQGSSTIKINVVDDVPQANDDREDVKAGETVTGNVLVNDTHGADGEGKFPDGATVRWDLPDGAKENPDGSYTIDYPGKGTLTLNPDGSYEFKSLPDAPNSELPEIPYTIVDSDGDISDAGLTIGITNKGGEKPGPEDPGKPEDPDNPVIVKPEDPNRPDPDGPKGEDPDNPEDPGLPKDNPDGSLNVNNENDVLTVYEKYLPDGSENGNGQPVANGVMDIEAKDGVAKIEIGGKVVWENGSLTDDVTIKTDEGTFEVTGFNPDTGKLTYKFTLEENTNEHKVQDAADSISHTLTVVVTDTDGDKGASTIKINVVDDVPTANNDNMSLKAGETKKGDVLENDVYGADGKGTFEGGETVIWTLPENAVENPDGSYTIKYEGQGVLTLKTDGSYSFTADANATVSSIPEVPYKIVDTDGDTSNAVLTIDITNAVPTLTPTKPTPTPKEPDPEPDDPNKPDNPDKPTDPDDPDKPVNPDNPDPKDPFQPGEVDNTDPTAPFAKIIVDEEYLANGNQGAGKEHAGHGAKGTGGFEIQLNGHESGTITIGEGENPLTIEVIATENGGYKIGDISGNHDFNINGVAITFLPDDMPVSVDNTGKVTVKYSYELTESYEHEHTAEQTGKAEDTGEGLVSTDSIKVQVTDSIPEGKGDTAVGYVKVEIHDDVPVVTPVGTAQNAVNVSMGADDNKDDGYTQVTGDDLTVKILGVDAGVNPEFKDAEGNSVTDFYGKTGTFTWATTVKDAGDKDVAVDVNLVCDNDGNYTFSLSYPETTEHNTDATIKLKVQATDADGDVAAKEVTVGFTRPSIVPTPEPKDPDDPNPEPTLPEGYVAAIYADEGKQPEDGTHHEAHGTVNKDLIHDDSDTSFDVKLNGEGGEIMVGTEAAGYLIKVNDSGDKIDSITALGTAKDGAGIVVNGVKVTIDTTSTDANAPTGSSSITYDSATQTWTVGYKAVRSTADADKRFEHGDADKPADSLSDHINITVTDNSGGDTANGKILVELHDDVDKLTVNEQLLTDFSLKAQATLNFVTNNTDPQQVGNDIEGWTSTNPAVGYFNGDTYKIIATTVTYRDGNPQNGEDAFLIDNSGWSGEGALGNFGLSGQKVLNVSQDGLSVGDPGNDKSWGGAGQIQTSSAKGNAGNIVAEGVVIEAEKGALQYGTTLEFGKLDAGDRIMVTCYTTPRNSNDNSYMFSKIYTGEELLKNNGRADIVVEDGFNKVIVSSLPKADGQIEGNSGFTIKSVAFNRVAHHTTDGKTVLDPGADSQGYVDRAIDLTDEAKEIFKDGNEYKTVEVTDAAGGGKYHVLISNKSNSIVQAKLEKIDEETYDPQWNLDGVVLFEGEFNGDGTWEVRQFYNFTVEHKTVDVNFKFSVTDKDGDIATDEKAVAMINEGLEDRFDNVLTGYWSPDTTGNAIINKTHPADDFNPYNWGAQAGNDQTADIMAGGSKNDIIFGRGGKDILFGDGANANGEADAPMNALFGALGMETKEFKETDELGKIIQQEEGDNAPLVKEIYGKLQAMANDANRLDKFNQAMENAEDKSNSGDDAIYGGLGDDILFGGAGNDLLVANGKEWDPSYRLHKNTITGKYEYTEEVVFSTDHDMVFGGSGNDIILYDDASDLYYKSPSFVDRNPSDMGDPIVHGGSGLDILLVGNKTKDFHMNDLGQNVRSIEVMIKATDTPHVETLGITSLGALEKYGVIVDKSSNHMELDTGRWTVDTSVKIPGLTVYKNMTDGLTLETTVKPGDVVTKGGKTYIEFDHEDGINDGFGGSDRNLLAGSDGNDNLVMVDNADSVMIGDGGEQSIAELMTSLGLNQFVNADGSPNLQAIEADIAKHNNGKIFEMMNKRTAEQFNSFESKESNEAGDDSLVGGDGWNMLFGRGGNDYLDGGNGSDFMIGGSGNDILLHDPNDFLIHGGSGTDLILANNEMSFTRWDKDGYPSETKVVTLADMFKYNANHVEVRNVEILLKRTDDGDIKDLGITSHRILQARYGVTIENDALVLGGVWAAVDPVGGMPTYEAEFDGIKLQIQTSLSQENISIKPDNGIVSIGELDDDKLVVDDVDNDNKETTSKNPEINDQGDENSTPETNNQDQMPGSMTDVDQENQPGGTDNTQNSGDVVPTGNEAGGAGAGAEQAGLTEEQTAQLNEINDAFDLGMTESEFADLNSKGLILFGNDGANKLGSDKGGEVIFGEGGNDLIFFGANDYLIDGGTGIDLMIAQDENELTLDQMLTNGREKTTGNGPMVRNVEVMIKGAGDVDTLNDLETEHGIKIEADKVTLEGNWKDVSVKGASTVTWENGGVTVETTLQTELVSNNAEEVANQIIIQTETGGC